MAGGPGDGGDDSGGSGDGDADGSTVGKEQEKKTKRRAQLERLRGIRSLEMAARPLFFGPQAPGQGLPAADH